LKHRARGPELAPEPAAANLRKASCSACPPTVSGSTSRRCAPRPRRHRQV